MPTRSLVLLLAVAACAGNPDPRGRPAELVARDGHGGWIVVTDRRGTELSGELIAIDPDAVRLLGPAGLVSIARSDIESAELWAWDSQYGNLWTWGGLGAVSTITHGFWLVFSAPIWIVTTGITATIQRHAPLRSYPDDGWDKLAIWARFPQGMPPGVYAGDLVQQHRAPAPAPPEAAPAPPEAAPAPPEAAPAPAADPAAPPAAAGSGAGSGSADRPPDP
jgi:hypothetical protein